MHFTLGKRKNSVLLCIFELFTNQKGQLKEDIVLKKNVLLKTTLTLNKYFFLFQYFIARGCFSLISVNSNKKCI